MVNPLADLSLPGDKNNYDRLVAGGELEFQIYDGLTFRSSVNVDLSFGGTDGWTPNYYLNSNRSQGYSSVHGTMNRGFVWQVENVLTYHKVFAEKHNLTVMPPDGICLKRKVDFRIKDVSYGRRPFKGQPELRYKHA